MAVLPVRYHYVIGDIQGCADALQGLLRQIDFDPALDQLWVAGALGAVAHSIGQMAMAIALTGTVSLAVYLPVMIVISILTGLFTGLCAQFLVNREKLWKIISK